MSKNKRRNRPEGGRTEQAAKPEQQTREPSDTDKVRALIEDAANLTPFWKKIYLEVLVSDPGILHRTGAYETAEGLKREGPAYLMEEGKLRDIYSLGFTPQTIDALNRSMERRELASGFTTGTDLFRQLRDNPDSFKDLDALCEAAPLAIKKQYIIAVSGVFTEGQKAKGVLQRMVNYSTGIGKVDEDDPRGGHGDWDGGWGFRSRSWKDSVDRGLSYVANALELKSSAKWSGFDEDQHPVIVVLEKFIRSLPRESFDIDHPLQAQAPASGTFAGGVAGPKQVSAEKQAEIDDVTRMFFRNRAKPDKENPDKERS